MNDDVYMLVNRRTGAFWYSPPATSATDCWFNARLWEAAQTGLQMGKPDVYKKWSNAMKARGWRALRVTLTHDKQETQTGEQ